MASGMGTLILTGSSYPHDVHSWHGRSQKSHPNAVRRFLPKYRKEVIR